METASKTQKTPAKTMTKMKQKLLEDEYEDLAMRGTPWDGTAEGRKEVEETWKRNEARMEEILALLEECGCEALTDEEEEALEAARKLQEEFYVKQLGETEGKLRAAKVWAELAEQEDEEEEWDSCAPMACGCCACGICKDAKREHCEC